MSDKANYPCKNHAFPGFAEASDPAWEQAPEALMADTETGKRPFLLTAFRALRDDAQEALFIRFEAQDDQVVSTFRWDDEPLYQQDVLEVFITSKDPKAGYLELEASPYDLRFVGEITYNSPQERVLTMGIDLPGFQTRTHFDEPQHLLTSVWRLPYSAFSAKSGKGQRFSWNLYRVDHSERGISLQAWQATLAPSFHVPKAFGQLEFV